MTRASRVLHRLVRSCGKPHASPRRHWAQARCRPSGSPSMESTSGAADPGALRGASGEATLNPRRQGCASNLSRQPCRTSPGGARKRYPPDPRPVLPVPRFGESGGRAAQAGRRGDRAPDARARPAGRNRWGRRHGVSQAGGPLAVSLVRPTPRRLRDRKCSSGSSWGKALVTGHRPAWGPGKARAPHRRLPPATRGAGRRKPSGPWLVKPRLMPGRRPSPGKACERKLMRRSRRRPEARAHPDRAVGSADGASTSSGATLPAQRELGGSSRQAGRGFGWSWSCSQAVLIAEVDEERRARSHPSGDGGASSRAGDRRAKAAFEAGA